MNAHELMLFWLCYWPPSVASNPTVPEKLEWLLPRNSSLWHGVDIGEAAGDLLTGPISIYLHDIEPRRTIKDWATSLDLLRTHANFLTRRIVGYNQPRCEKLKNHNFVVRLDFFRLQLLDCALDECKVLNLFALLAMLCLDGLSWKEEDAELVRVVSETSQPLPTPKQLMGALLHMLRMFPRLVLSGGWPLIAFAAAQLASLPHLLEGIVYEGDVTGDDAVCADFLGHVPVQVHSGDPEAQHLLGLAMTFLEQVGQFGGHVMLKQHRLCHAAASLASAVAANRVRGLLPSAILTLIESGWTWAKAVYVTLVFLDRAMLATKVTIQRRICEKCVHVQQTSTPLAFLVLPVREETSDAVRVFPDLPCTVNFEVVARAADVALQISAQIHVLDIGAAFGQCSVPLRWLFGRRVRLTLVEPSARLRRVMLGNLLETGGIEGQTVIAGFVGNLTEPLDPLITPYDNLLVGMPASMASIEKSPFPYYSEHASYKPVSLRALLSDFADIMVAGGMGPPGPDLSDVQIGGAPCSGCMRCKMRIAENVFAKCGIDPL